LHVQAVRRLAGKLDLWTGPDADVILRGIDGSPLAPQSEERREFELRIAEVSEKPLPPRARDSMRRSYSPKATEIDSSVLVSAIPARISLVPNRVRSPSAAAPHRLRA
jgi:hypothetical protein